MKYNFTETISGLDSFDLFQAQKTCSTSHKNLDIRSPEAGLEQAPLPTASDALTERAFEKDTKKAPH
ncbi:hypothetical protein LX99_00809 [Mucilaginibacter oryzae]|uniref:Uncharacterized protein n=1 Tax=Mucilaginibacter oryzae TaxID=468058 RepID=A0A316HGJ2_9SPHI|nr:hypothetical protein LX99_00809 [Mucilaginibacter oryzae]